MEKFEKLDGNVIRPCGWLQRQLNLQLTGLSGNMHKIFEDVSDNSAWLGGNGEAWERGPYYLDGIIPLAFLTGDEALKARAARWVDSILASENDYVGFGPKRCVDWWPRFVVLKALRSWVSFTGDERVLPFVLRYFDYMNAHIMRFPPKYWAHWRAFECLEALEWAYEETGNETLVELAGKLDKLSFDWAQYMTHFRFLKPMTAYYSRRVFNFGKNVGEKWDAKQKQSLKVPRKQLAGAINTYNKNLTVRLIQETHAVNIAMGFKYPVTVGTFLGKSEYRNAAKLGYLSIQRAHGLAIGLPSGDEHLMGPSPSQGVELCAVVEFMYSMEELLRVTGNAEYAELLEYVCFNALPATFTADMCAHQYVQQVNQIACNLDKHRDFFALHEDANTFGIAPNFGCCAANMHQGFPKFAMTLAMKRGSGLVFPVYAPMEVDATVDGKRYHVKESTLYPFGDTVTFTVLDGVACGTLTFRLPAELRDVLLNGERVSTEGMTDYVTISRDFAAGDKIELVTAPRVRFMRNADGSLSVRRGQLLYALALAFEEQKLSGEEPFHNRAFVTTQKWNYGLTIRDEELLSGKKLYRADGATFTSRGIGEKPFDKSNPPSVITLDAREITNWTEKNGSAGPYPQKPKYGAPAELSLVPYGNTILRIAQFPSVDEPALLPKE